ncbi:Ig-like domain-containing protein [Listeria grandensis]|uniref:Ig-like domain-containing protein n=1 Tax=Listeria grandensis TaxID=1494963 RepID=UPI00164DD0C2|nr:Ig-like domain-containing protein [Listeria grandensis]MBC6314433.1 hypothetical protein [Listeria grandensis]
MKNKKKLAGLLMVAGLACTTPSIAELVSGASPVEAAELPNLNTAGDLLETKASKAIQVQVPEDLNVAQSVLATALTGGTEIGSTKIWGKTLPGAELRLVKNPTIHPVEFVDVTADAEGNFEAELLPLKVGDVIWSYPTVNGIREVNDVAIILPETIKKENLTPITTNSDQVIGKNGVPGAIVYLGTRKTDGSYYSTMTTVNRDGSYILTIPKQPEGTTYNIYQKVYYAPDRYSDSKTTIVKAIQGIEEPKVSPVTSNSTSVTGKGKPGAVVRVKVSRTEIGKASVDEQGDFEVAIPKQKLGTKLSVTQEQDLDVSDAEQVIVDQEAPTVTSTLTDGVTSVSGTAFPGASVTVWTGGANPVATVKADELTGKWSATVPALVAGNAVQVRSTTELGKYKDSEKYGIALGSPRDIRAVVADNQTKVTGKGSPGATINISIKGSKARELLGSTTADKSGNFEIIIPKELEAAQLVVTQAKNGVTSETAEATVVKGLDKVSNIKKVTANSTTVSGKGSAGATVSVKVNGNEIGTGTVDADGNFTARIAKQAEGSKLAVTQKQDENESAAVEVTVVKGLEKVTNVSTLTPHSTRVTGKGVSGATVSIKVNGTEIATGSVKTDGNFDIAIPKQAEGAKLLISQTKDEDESEATEVTVTKGLADPTISDYYLGVAYLKGKAPENAVQVSLVIAGKIVRTVSVAADGSYSIYCNDVVALQQAGASFGIVARDANNLLSGEVTSTVQTVAVPTVSRYQLGQTYVTGRVSEGSTRIAVYDKTGKILRYGQINADLTFRINVADQEAFKVLGDSFTVRAFHVSGAVSNAVSGKIESDGMVAPTIEKYYLNAAYIRGKAPSGATRVRLSVNGVTTRVHGVAEDGSYSIYANDIAGLKEVGAKFEIVALDGNNLAGDKTSDTVTEVPKPVVNAYRLGQAYLTGTVAKGVEKITLYNGAGVALRTGQVNQEEGTFRVYVNGINIFERVGNKISVRAFTADGGVSDKNEVTVLTK